MRTLALAFVLAWTAPSQAGLLSCLGIGGKVKMDEGTFYMVTFTQCDGVRIPTRVVTKTEVNVVEYGGKECYRYRITTDWGTPVAKVHDSHYTRDWTWIENPDGRRMNWQRSHEKTRDTRVKVARVETPDGVIHRNAYLQRHSDERGTVDTYTDKAYRLIYSVSYPANGTPNDWTTLSYRTENAP